MEPFSQLISSDTPVLVDFYADWCQPCKLMNPVIVEVAKAIKGKARVIKINIDSNQETARRFNVQAVPTFIIFKKGIPVWRHSGMVDKSSLLDTLSRNAD